VPVSTTTPQNHLVVFHNKKSFQANCGIQTLEETNCQSEGLQSVGPFVLSKSNQGVLLMCSHLRGYICALTSGVVDSCREDVGLGYMVSESEPSCNTAFVRFAVHQSTSIQVDDRAFVVEIIDLFCCLNICECGCVSNLNKVESNDKMEWRGRLRYRRRTKCPGLSIREEMTPSNHAA